MADQKLIEDIVRQVLADMRKTPVKSNDFTDVLPAVGECKGDCLDITSPDCRTEQLITDAEDRDSLMRMKNKTSARIGVGRAGGRLRTQTLLTLRADHAAARDAAFMDVSERFLEELGLFTVRTTCADKNNFLTNPDAGKVFSGEAVEMIKSRCRMNPDVQICASDGLSSKAIEANLANILPAITDGFTARGITVGTPFFVKYGRVGAQDALSEIIRPKVICTLIGERPGLVTAESMSAYITYEARAGMPEARRTVVSNIHKGGISAVEAGAYIAELIEKILKAKASGVELTSE